MTTETIVTRHGQEVEVTIRWSVRGGISRWRERHPYGMSFAYEEMAEAEVDEVEIDEEIWPKGFKDEQLSEGEIAHAREAALDHARENAAEYISD